jgi:hypothetical protein
VTCWRKPEYPQTLNRRQLGNLGLSDKQEDQIVSFLKTLTDGFAPPQSSELNRGLCAHSGERVGISVQFLLSGSVQTLEVFLDQQL